MLEDPIEIKTPEPKHHILFVDDEEPLGELLVEFFTEKNFKSAYVLNADDAIKYLENNRVDVVVSNINMPGMNGIEMTEIIRNKYSARVVIFTGYSSPENRKKSYQKGAHAYLAKPAPIEQLYERVMKLLHENVVYIGH